MVNLREKMRSGVPLAGTFLKTPAIEMIEVLAKSGLDFLCLDAEHAPFDRGRLDACLAVARALDFPMLVRVPAGTPDQILTALDAGATGIVVPHVLTAAQAAAIAKASRFGAGGRGYAGSTRWAGYATRPVAEVLAQAASETIVVAQIEDIEAVEAVEEIAAVPGLDALFLGPADLTVAYGHTTQDNPDLAAAVTRVGAAAEANGLAYMSFVPNAEAAAAWRGAGMTVFFVASEHAWMLQGATAAAAGIHALEGKS